MYQMSGQYDEWFAAHQPFEPNQPIEPWYFIATGRSGRRRNAPLRRHTRERPFESFACCRPKRLLAAAKGRFPNGGGGDSRRLLDRHPVKDPFYHHTAYFIACYLRARREKRRRRQMAARSRGLWLFLCIRCSNVTRLSTASGRRPNSCSSWLK